MSEKNMGDLELEGILQAAKMMSVVARTAPKTRGVDDIVVKLVAGKEVELIADKLDEMGKKRNRRSHLINAEHLRKTPALLLIGVKYSKGAGLDCGGCGFETCSEFNSTEQRHLNDYYGPNCIMKVMDLGIAIGSVVKFAGELCVDNRIMYSAGSAAIQLGLMDAQICLAVPLSATGKNIYWTGW
jgi:uncharacterized ferredoxin-like protein